MKVSAKDKVEAIAALHEILKPGDTVYSIVRTVAKSGMSRTIDFYVFRDNRPVYLTGYMSTALGIPRATGAHWALKISGCGMDMCFATVYDLSMTLFCPGKYDHDAAYSLKSEVL